MKTVLITGASGGIGRAIAERFAITGEYNLILHARKSTEQFQRLCTDLMDKYEVNVRPIYFDMTDYSKMAQEIQALNKEKTYIDVLVNNAGVAHGGFFQMTKLEEIKEVFEVNFFSAIRLTQLVARGMTRNKKGVIVNMTSVAGEELEVGNCAYGTSKAALIAFTKTGAKELAAHGVRMNAVAPGLVDTDMAKQMKNTNGDDMINRAAIKRLCAPEEIADAVYFLSSDQSTFITGHILNVNGGML